MAPPTLALSLIQPWAWAVIHGTKDIENRTWWSELRGPFWIAASAQVTRRYYDQARELIKSIGGVDCPPLKELDFGCIIGRATITDCILPGGYVSKDKDDCRTARVAYQLYGPNWGDSCRPPLAEQISPWHFAGQYGYVLSDRVAITNPVPCKGHQRWWRVPPALLEQLRSAA